MNRNFVIAFIATLALSASAAADRGHKGKRFEKLDTDSSGSISLAELTSNAETRFSKLDGDKNGRVSQDEMKAHHDQMHAKWKEKKGDKARKHGKHGDSERHAQKHAKKQERKQARMAERFAQLDLNKDGAIEKNEMVGQAKQRFEKLDTDKNGSLDKTEMRRGKHERMKHRKFDGERRGKRGQDKAPKKG